MKGGFRAITGLVGKLNKHNYKIATPTATIGIRGTDHETFVVPIGSTTAAAGAYSKVNVGETTLTTNKGTVNVLPNQMGFSGGMNELPKLEPINTNIFTVSAAPTKSIKESKSESKGKSGGETPQTASNEKNKTSETGQDQRPDAEAQSEAAPGAPEPMRETSVLDNTKLAENINTTVSSNPGTVESATIATVVAPPTPQLPVTASSGGLTLNATTQTVASGNSTVPVQNGIYSIQAKTAADAALVAAKAAATEVTAATNAEVSLKAITTVSTAPATTAIATATTNIGTVTPLVAAATALTPANAGTAAADAQTTAASSSTQAGAAQAAITANGSFADTTAIEANNVITSANALVQAANATVQTNAAEVATQNSALSIAQTAASSALSSANNDLATATNTLGTVNTQISVISAAQTAAASLLSTAQAAANAAQTAATAAQTAATLADTLQAAGDFTGAAAQLAIAQQQLVIAQAEQANAQAAHAAVTAQLAAAQAAQTAANDAVTFAVNVANTAATAAATSQTQAGIASGAATNAAAALTTTTSPLSGLITNAATVAANVPIAAYNNPAVASSNFIGHLVMPAPAVAGGYYSAQESNNQPISNTKFVLDGTGNLVEIRSTGFQIQPMGSVPTTTIANADVKWSGGTAAETFKMADNSIYAGRWAGATVTVTDLATITTPFTPFSLTPINSLWAVLLTPGSGYVQSLVGTTNYTKVAATLPFDALGNLGTLNSATLSADFTNQLVSAVLNLTMPTGLMAGTYAIAASNMPINTVASGNGSGGFGGNIIPTISCTGTCSAGAGGYSASIGGSFAGTAAASAALGYDIWPTTTPGAPVPDLVQGLVAFNTVTTPAIAPFAAYNTNHVAVESTGGFGTGGGSGNMAKPADLAYVTGTVIGTSNLSTSGALSSMTFRDFGGGSNYVATSTISGGTASSANAPSFATTGIQYGAWTGYTGQSNTWTSQLGAQQKGNGSSGWMYGPQGYLDTIYLPTGLSLSGAMAGTFNYQMDGGTAPQSMNSGLTGALTSASITADFVNMLVSANLALTMPGSENWAASMAAQAINGTNFGSGASGVTVSYGIGVAPTTCATCGGNLSGMFTGQNYAGAILTYNLYSGFINSGDQVQGNVALTRNYTTGNQNPAVTNSTPITPVNIVVATGMNGGGSNISLYPVASSTTTGNLLTSFNSSGSGNGFTTTNSTTVTNCLGCTSTPSGQVASSGIYYGNWTDGLMTQTYSQTTTMGSPTPSYWITGPEAGPLYLPQALTGTATFSLNAGQVSNGMGVGAGTVQGTTALTLNFDKQTVGINLDVSIQDTAATPVLHTWNAKTVAGQEAVLGNGQGIGSAAFYASTFNNGGGSGLLTLTVDGLAANVTNTSGNINGQLTGSGLTGAIMSFNLGGTLNAATAAPTFENINGVAAFTGTASNISTPHRYVSIAFYDPFAAVPLPLLGFYANADSATTPAVGAKMDANGNLIQFDNQFINNNGGGSSNTFNSSTGTTPTLTTTLTDHGSDPVSGISWGRWSGGTFNATDRQTGAIKSVTQAGSLHWITEPVATSATTLPIAGTFAYTYAGGTTPTDNIGTPGTLNSATLSADFSNMNVTLGVNVTVAGATLNTTGTNVPIIQNTVFYASSQEPAASTSYLNVGCTGTCGTTLGGTVIGKFTGAGAIGAAMTYGLQNGSSVVSGVAAFHR